MPVRVIDGNLFDSKAKYICHQVNCQGKMGSGVARTVREKFPKVFEEYKKMCDSSTDRSELLGCVQLVRCRAWENEVFICNLFSQDRYGYDGKRYTNYDAFVNCMRGLQQRVPKGETIAMPYQIGCSLGGGSWDVIYGIIKGWLGDDYNVELWRLNKDVKRPKGGKRPYR